MLRAYGIMLMLTESNTIQATSSASLIFFVNIVMSRHTAWYPVDVSGFRKKRNCLYRVSQLTYRAVRLSYITNA